MNRRRHILLLGGSSETRAIAEAVAKAGYGRSVLLPKTPRSEGREEMPGDPFACADPAALTQKASEADMILDASHGFDPSVTQAGFAVASAMGLPFATLVRPPWDVAEHPRWRAARDMVAAVSVVAGRRVFAATGWDSLEAVEGFRGERLFLRQKQRHARPVPHPFVEPVFGVPPFSVAQEVALFERLGVDAIICRNMGGTASRPKLEAAKLLDLEVILIARPAPPEGADVVDTVRQALTWIAAQG